MRSRITGFGAPQPYRRLHPRFPEALLAFSTAVLLLGTTPAWSQVDRSDDFVFDDSSVPSIAITIDQAHLDDLFAPGNQYSDEERPAGFTFVRGLDTMRVDSVGFRFRGNTSRDSQKKSFKVSFNTFRRGQKFLGLEKLNINGEHNDPSIMRSKIGWDLFRSMGVPASRANHVRLYINDKYFGLYMNVEHVDEQFLQRHFENDGGNLYKCLWPADLVWLGPDGGSYRPVNADRRPYDLKLKDSDLEGYDDLAHFIDVLNNTGAVEFPVAIEAVFNVNGFLRALAVTTITGSWDSYWFLKNNFYLYSNPETGRFEYVPFDMDNTMGIWWEGIYPGLDWGRRDVYSWGHPDPNEHRPLADRILAVPEFRARYTLYLKRLLDAAFDQTTLESRIMDLRSLIEDAAAEDVYRTLDYGFSIQDFYASYTAPLGGHVVYGLFPFISERVRSATSQLDIIDVKPVLSEFTASPAVARPGAIINVSVRVEDEDQDPDVRLYFRTGSSEEQTKTLNRTPESGLDVFSAQLVAPSEPSTIVLRVTAMDRAGQTSVSEEKSVPVLQEVDLVINELMAANVSTIHDGAGEFDDWLELYNAGSESLPVGGFTLTDDRARPAKWVLPDTSIAAGGFLIVWADENASQGPMHANFRLSKLGEYLGLFDAAGVPLDTLAFPSQVDDVSFGRAPDAGPSWVAQAQATPGGPNSGPVHVESSLPVAPGAMSVYPNPFTSAVHAAVRSPSGGMFEVFDLLGRRVAIRHIKSDAPAVFRWDGHVMNGEPVPAGVYILRFTDTSGATQVTSIVRLR